MGLRLVQPGEQPYEGPFDIEIEGEIYRLPDTNVFAQRRADLFAAGPVDFDQMRAAGISVVGYENPGHALDLMDANRNFVLFIESFRDRLANIVPTDTLDGFDGIIPTDDVHEAEPAYSPTGISIFSTPGEQVWGITEPLGPPNGIFEIEDLLHSK